MNLAIIGYGKMGHEVEKKAIEMGHNISVIIDNDNDWVKNKNKITECNAAIIFTTPDCAVDSIMKCFDSDLPVIIGTTGWDNKKDEVAKYCINNNKSLLWANNFSIGVNIFFEINKLLSSFIKRSEQYTVSIEETHHIHKLDSPSGTAISLAEYIINGNENFKGWNKGFTDKKDIIPILSLRENEIIGDHKVTYNSDCDSITFIHSAKNRSGFAEGAVSAANWIQGKKGFFTMKDMLFE